MTETKSPARFYTPSSPWRSWWDSEKLNDARLMKKVWLVSRLVLFLEWAAMLFTLGDTRYYYENISRMGVNGPEATMIEYPTPVLWLLKIPDLVTFGHRWVYVAGFFGLMFLLDAAFTWTLWHDGGRLRGKAVAFWSAFVPLVGTTVYLRFDIITAVLAGWALLLLRKRQPLASGAMIGIGAAIKLWPALLWPALLGDREHGDVRRNRWLTSLGFWGAGGLLALASLVWAGWDRLVSPLGWQGERGLQIESVWATIPMLQRMMDPHSYWVAVSEFNAWEISGPGTKLFFDLAGAATAVGMLAAVGCYLLWLRRGDQRLIEGAALMLLVIFVMIVTNKTFSPQYIIWVGGPLAAGWAMASENPRGSYRARSDEHTLAEISEWTLLVTLLTQVVYPIGYASLVGHRPGMHGATLVLAARNLVLCWVLFKVAAWVWSFLHPRQIEATRLASDRESH
ncbi:MULTISPECIES: glycosyltransferase family 87 protein [unclassified Luteococcus]|uniref:glycosyltransferase family 87 protein n=1 Tax=unclassified Luteococcus TaxID=2639923 RepID=UPI00313A8CA8